MEAALKEFYWGEKLEDIFKDKKFVLYAEKFDIEIFLRRDELFCWLYFKHEADNKTGIIRKEKTMRPDLSLSGVLYLDNLRLHLQEYHSVPHNQKYGTLVITLFFGLLKKLIYPCYHSQARVNEKILKSENSEDDNNRRLHIWEKFNMCNGQDFVIDATLEDIKFPDINEYTSCGYPIKNSFDKLIEIETRTPTYNPDVIDYSCTKLYTSPFSVEVTRFKNNLMGCGFDIYRAIRIKKSGRILSNGRKPVMVESGEWVCIDNNKDVENIFVIKNVDFYRKYHISDDDNDTYISKCYYALNNLQLYIEDTWNNYYIVANLNIETFSTNERNRLSNELNATEYSLNYLFVYLNKIKINSSDYYAVLRPNNIDQDGFIVNKNKILQAKLKLKQKYKKSLKKQERLIAIKKYALLFKNKIKR